MRHPLSAALLLLCAAAFAQSDPNLANPDPKKKPKTLSDAACDESGSGLLVRFKGDEGRDAFEAEADADPGLEAVEPGDKPKKKKKKSSKPKTYRVKPGEGCGKSLGRIGGASGSRDWSDNVEVTAAPAAPPKDEAALDKYFKGAGTLRAVSRMSFKSSADLAKLFDNTSKLGSFEKAAKAGVADGSLAMLDGSVPGGAPGKDAVVVPQGPSTKANPAGTKWPRPNARVSPANASAPPGFGDEQREFEPPRRYSEYRVVRAFQRAGDWTSEAVSNAADRASFTYHQLRGDKPVENVGNLTVVGGWAQLPRSGPGFKFVGAGPFGMPHVVKTLMESAADPIVNIGSESPFPIVAISRYGGGPFPPHITHRQGIDVDVALVGYRNGPLDAKALDRNLLFAVSVVEHMKPTYILLDSRRQAELAARARALMTQSGVDETVKARVRAAYPLLFQQTPAPRGKPLFSHVEKHYDHFHIRAASGRLGM